jgi:hypothetical protein
MLHARRCNFMRYPYPETNTPQVVLQTSEVIPKTQEWSDPPFENSIRQKIRISGCRTNRSAPSVLNELNCLSISAFYFRELTVPSYRLSFVLVLTTIFPANEMFYNNGSRVLFPVEISATLEPRFSTPAMSKTISRRKSWSCLINSALGPATDVSAPLEKGPTLLRIRKWYCEQ